MNITRERLRSWRVCYSDARIAELVPPEGVTLEQVLDSSIPHADKIWVADRILSRAARLELRARLVERCLVYGSLTDERITCLPAALRADAIMPEMRAALPAAVALVAPWAAAVWAVEAAPDPEAERKRQLDDIRELMAK